MFSLSVFRFDGQEIRFVDGKPVGIDVARALGYQDPKTAVRDLVDTEYKGVGKIPTIRYGENSARMQEITFLEEAGIYQLIFKSKMPMAKSFQKWVFEEVLPSIRKTGQYGVPLQEQSIISQIGEAIDAIFSNINIDSHLVAGVKLNAIQKQVPEIAPAIEESRQLLINDSGSSSTLLTPTALGKAYLNGLSAVRVNQLLVEKGFQILNPNKRSKKDPSYIPTDKGKEFCFFTLSTGKGDNHSTYQQLRWYPDVITQLI